MTDDSSPQPNDSAPASAEASVVQPDPVPPPAETPPAQPVEAPQPTTAPPVVEPPVSPSVPMPPVPPAVSVRDLLTRARQTIASRKRKKLDAIVTALKKHGPMTNGQIRDAVPISESTATRYLDILEKEG